MFGVRSLVEGWHLLISATHIEPPRLNKVISRVEFQPRDSTMSGYHFDLRQKSETDATAAMLLNHEHPGDLPDQTPTKTKTNTAYGIANSVSDDKHARCSGEVITRSQFHLL